MDVSYISIFNLYMKYAKKKPLLLHLLTSTCFTAARPFLLLHFAFMKQLSSNEMMDKQVTPPTYSLFSTKGEN